MSTSSSASWPARVDRGADLRHAARHARRGLVVDDHHRADRRVAAQDLLRALGIGAVAPVARHPHDLEPEPLGHRPPQRREVAGLEREHAVAGRERVDERRLPRAGARRRVDDDRPVGPEHVRAGPSSTSSPSPAKSGPRWSIVGASIARRTRSGHVRRPGDLQEVASAAEAHSVAYRGYMFVVTR